MTPRIHCPYGLIVLKMFSTIKAEINLPIYDMTPDPRSYHTSRSATPKYTPSQNTEARPRYRAPAKRSSNP